MQFNQILQPRFSSLLTRMFAIRGAGSPAPTLAPEIAPSVDVNQQDDPALFYTRTERLMGGRESIAGVAASYSKYLIRNPANSGALIIIERMQVTAGNIVFAVIQAAAANLANNSNAGTRDSRWLQNGGGSPGVALCSYEATAGVIPGTAVWAFQPNSSETVEMPIVLHPGYGMYVWNTTLAAAISTMAVHWRERVLPNEEIGTG